MSAYRIYFGKKFYQQKGGYWANMMPIHAHRWVWINHFGAIPKGMDIHHKDGDKSNNEIENLEMLSRSDHLKQHWKEGRFDVPARRIQLSEARKWLKTPEGREKQSIASKKAWETRRKINIKCKNCKKEFESTQPNANFCHHNCYMQNRRKSGIDDIVKKCRMCDKDFIIHKHSRVQTCGKDCGTNLQKLGRLRNLNS